MNPITLRRKALAVLAYRLAGRMGSRFDRTERLMRWVAFHLSDCARIRR